jgi:cysteine-rich repeat protein
MTLVAAGAVLLTATAGRAAEIGVVPTKLIVLDKLVLAGKAKTVFVAKDPVVDKGPGTDVEDISVTFGFRYNDTRGEFVLPEGESDGIAGWLVNKSTVAKYVNSTAPTGPTGTKVSVLKQNNLVKLVGKTLGDTPIDLILTGAPTGSVFTAYTVRNGATVNTFCSEWPLGTCSLKLVGADTGRKLVCKGEGLGLPDPLCVAAPASCVGGAPNGTPEGDEECDDGNADPTDGCTNACTICGDGIVSPPEDCDDLNLVNGDGCDANCRTTGCGNGIVLTPETCDDGNTHDNDSCPSDCIVDACDPDTGSDVTGSVNFTGSELVAGITVLLDYPEGKVSIPGSGAGVPSGIITDLPGFAFGQSNDLDHALIQAVVDGTAFPSGLLFKVHFEDCLGPAAPDVSEFTCTVLAAGDEFLAPVPGVTCSVSIP